MARRRADRRRRWYKTRQGEDSQYSGNTAVGPIGTIDGTESMQALIEKIPNLSLEQFPIVVEMAALLANVDMQEEVLTRCLRRILHFMDPNADPPRDPRPEQIRVLRRLVFCKGDTLLVARTGFGKSLVLHAFPILTGKITLQIIPLNKLGDEQCDDIRKLPGSRPCLITSETKSAQQDLLNRVCEGEYTHVLLGPEQASSKIFRNMLKGVAFQNRIGLVAIDECHLVKQWRDFRPAFTMLGELRLVLHRDVVWFGCSATLDDEAEELVLSCAGFRTVGKELYQTEIIRTSVNRPDVAISIQPLARRKINSFETLCFLLDTSTNSDGGATPENIPKTVVFVDGRIAVQRAAAYFQSVLLMKTSGCVDSSQQYSQDAASGSYCVNTVIEVFTAHVSKYDQDARYAEFKKIGSAIRIMFATTSLGMGVNIPDIERVVVWGFPISGDPGDHWQRLGRGGRGHGRVSIGYIFLPYWAFDSEGVDPSSEERSQQQSQTSKEARAASRRTSRLRNVLPGDRAIIRDSQRSIGDSQDFAPADVSDAESVTSRFSVATQVSLSAVKNSQEKRPKKWSKAELAKRAKLSRPWMDIINGTCHRKGFLTYLGEEKLPPCTESLQPPDGYCCSRCNPSLIPHLTLDLELPQPVTQPRTGTQASIALQLIDEWATTKAEALYTSVDRRFPMPACAYMDQGCRWQLAHLFNERPVVLETADSLSRCVPLLLSWPYWESSRDMLLMFLQSIVPEVDAEYDKLLAKRRQAKEAGARNQVVEQAVQVVPTTASEYNTIIRRRDDTLATQVARREAWKVAQTAGNVDPSTLPATTPPTTPSALRDWVTSIANTPQASPSGASNVPDDVPHGVLHALHRLQQARVVVANSQSDVDSQNVTLQPGIRDDRGEVVPDTQLSDLQLQDPIVEDCVTPEDSQGSVVRSRRGRKRQGSATSQSESATPSRRRKPLMEIDSNIQGDGNMNLRFVRTSGSGRVRRMTAKGVANFHVE